MIIIAWELLVGLGVFLYGMSRLEAGIGALSGPRLKRWLARSTASPIASVGLGAIITTILQSSSMVSLLLLAFASAGIIPLYNAIGVLIGANLGTTITGWFVVTLGFKLDLAKLALPLLGLGGLTQVMTEPSHRLYAWGKTATGLGLLLFGLVLMKDSVGEVSQQWDISLLQGHHPVIYLVTGILFTALIQSSSATVMLTLAALHGGLISLPEAGALVIGADLGTTGTTLLASLTGPSIKRQLALAQLVFNFVVDMSAFIFLLPLLPWFAQWLGAEDPLYVVVAFHTTLNLLGVFAFLPFLKPFSHWVERFFKSPQDSISLLAEITTPVPEAALPAIEQTLQTLWLTAAINAMRLLGIKFEGLKISTEQKQKLNDVAATMNVGSSHRQIYEQIKHHETEIFELAYRLQQVRLNEYQSKCLGRMQELTRNIVYASKTMQDIASDIEQLRSGSQTTNLAASWQLAEQQRFLTDLYANMLPLVIEKHENDYLQELLETLKSHNDLHYQNMVQGTYQRASSAVAKTLGLSIQLNINREVHHAIASLLDSVKLFQKIKPKQAL